MRTLVFWAATEVGLTILYILSGIIPCILFTNDFIASQDIASYPGRSNGRGMRLAKTLQRYQKHMKKALENNRCKNYM